MPGKKTRLSSLIIITDKPEEKLFDDEEMSSALLLLENYFGGFNKMGQKISEALNQRRIVIQKLVAFLDGEEPTISFLNTITKPRWLLILLHSVLGSMKNVLQIIELYQTFEVGSQEHKEITSKLIGIVGQEKFLKDFVNRFTLLKAIIVSSLAEQLNERRELVEETVDECLEGSVVSLKRIEALTGAKSEEIHELFEALKHCDEVEIEAKINQINNRIFNKLVDFRF